MVLRKRLVLVVSILVLFGLLPSSGWAQSEFEIIPEEPVYIFGERITFKAVLHTKDGIDQVLLYVQTSDEADLQVFPVVLDDSGNLSLEIDLLESLFPGFADIRYWYQANMDSGETYQSSVYSFTYSDNRYQWKTLTGEQFTIYWYAGDLTFGEEVLNVALEGVRGIQELLEVFFPVNMEIYIYDDVLAMQAAVPDAGQYWIAGHADPIQGVILVTLAPGPEQRLEMERQIPHELMHVALNYTDSHAYSNFPVWFNEGLASLVELYPNPEYPILIENAYEAGELIPMGILCQSFPSDPGQALLAYAQSASFTQFLHDQFGEPGFNRMMAAYASGLNCEQGIEEALGSSLASLEESWQRTSFTGVTLGIAFRELLPWLVLLLVVLAGPLILVGAVIRRRPARKEYE
jgi:hypothetical protein